MATPYRLMLILLAAVAVAASHPAHEFCSAAGGGAGSSCGGGDGTRILIKGGTVVNAHQAEEADVYIEDGVVVAVRPNIPVGDDNVKVIDATGKYVMPGGIDPHTHLEMEFMGTVTIDDFFSGHAAALAGGTTMHIDFVIPVNGNLTAGFESYKQKAEKSAMDYGFHMAITKWNDEVSREMEVMVREHGINSFKFFMAYKGSLMVTDDLLLQGLQKCKSLGALAMVHAENGDAVAEGQQRMIDLGITGPEGHALSRPPVLEGEATSRAIRLAKFVNTPLYVVHVMSIDAMEEIAKAKREGQRVIGEPVVSGLVLDDSWLWDPDFATASKYVMSPPIREAGHGKALQVALSSGILQLVGTDHCTFNSTQKAFGSDDFRKIPNGVNGIEERMHIVWDTMVETGKITVTDYVRVSWWCHGRCHGDGLSVGSLGRWGNRGGFAHSGSAHEEQPRTCKSEQEPAKPRNSKEHRDVPCFGALLEKGLLQSWLLHWQQQVGIYMGKNLSNGGPSSASRSTNQAVSLREEISGKTQADAPSLLRVQHLQRLAAWASGEAAVGPIGALLGHHLATDAVVAGIPIGASTFLCQRCESVLQAGFNCIIRIKKNKKKAKWRKKSNSGQNSVVYACHFCGDQNLIRGSGKGIVNGLLSSRKPASMDITNIMLKGESMNMATVATKNGIEHSVTAASELESYRFKTSTLEKDKHGNGQKSNLPEDSEMEKGDVFPMMDHGQLAAIVQEDLLQKVEVEGTTHDKCMNEIEPVSDISSQEEFLVGSTFVTPRKNKLAEVNAPKGSAEPLKTRSTLHNKGQSCVSVTAKAPRSCSKSASTTKSAPNDSTQPAGSSRKRARKGWTTLKQIAEKDELQRKEKMYSFVIPFFMQ